MKGRKIDHINITVPNIEKAIEFYTNVMGFEVANRFKKEKEFVFITNGDITYELMENPNLKEGIVDHIAYVSKDIEKDYEHFLNLGLTTTTLNYVDFLFENGVNYFFISGAGSEKIEFIKKK